MNKRPLHIPVLLEPVIKVFSSDTLHHFWDATLGLGGHAKALFEAHPFLETYYCCDKDPQAKAYAWEKLEPFLPRLHYENRGFCSMLEHLKQLKASLPFLDGVLVDLGVSSYQLDSKERGFSFLSEAPLDMRMDPQQKLHAKEIVNNWSQEALAQLFWEGGEERRGRRLAQAITKHRKQQPFETCLQLARFIEEQFPSRGKTHPATQAFQALRIAVNEELRELKNFLEGILPLMKQGAKLAIISFHSLEDRLVKHYFKKYAGLSYVNEEGAFMRDQLTYGQVLTPKPIGPSKEEIKANPRSRSAKLRVFQKQ